MYLDVLSYYNDNESEYNDVDFYSELLKILCVSQSLALVLLLVSAVSNSTS